MPARARWVCRISSSPGEIQLYKGRMVARPVQRDPAGRAIPLASKKEEYANFCKSNLGFQHNRMRMACMDIGWVFHRIDLVVVHRKGCNIGRLAESV